MKKTLLLLIALICIGFSVNAKEMFRVTVTVKVIYVYYDEYGGEVGRTSTNGTPQVIDRCADTPEKAKDDAKDECSTMCQGRKDEGKKLYNGKYYQCYSQKEVYDATARKLGQSC